MHLRITDELFDKFPDVFLGVVVARELDNSGEESEIPEITQRLRAAEAKVMETFSNVVLTEHPNIAPWREAYRTFGAKPKKYPSSIENLIRRTLKGNQVRHINTLVDLYNVISLERGLPVGGEDLDLIEGDILLTIGGDNEAPVTLLGEKEERPPNPGEVIYKDNVGAICRRWNWKEADRTKLTETTRNAVFVIEGLPPIDQAVIQSATAELASLIERWCGGTVSTFMLNREQSDATF